MLIENLAPVFGATPVAEAGTLLIAVSGPDSAVQEVKPLLRNALAREVLVVSEDTDKAVLLKTIGCVVTFSPPLTGKDDQQTDSVLDKAIS